MKAEPSSAAARRSSISSRVVRCTWVLRPGIGWPGQSQSLPRKLQEIWSSIALSGIHGSHGVCRTEGHSYIGAWIFVAAGLLTVKYEQIAFLPLREQ